LVLETGSSHTDEMVKAFGPFPDDIRDIAF